MTGAKRKARESFGAVRRLPSGRVQASYVGPDMNRHTAPATFDTLTDARAWLAIQRTRIARGEWQPAEAAKTAAKRRQETLGEYAVTWMDTRTNRQGEHLRPRTRTEYERLMRTALEPLAGRPLGGITTPVVREWYSSIIKRGTKTTAARAYGLLKSIMATAVEDGRIPTNPCTVRGGHMATTGKRVEPPTSAELEKIVDALPEKYKTAALLAAWTGVRYGELTELRRKDLTVLEGGETIIVNVSRAVTHVTGTGYVVGPTKTAAGVRAIVVPPHINGHVVDHLERHVGPGPESLLFPAADGSTHLAQSTLVKSYYPARVAAGRPDLPWHALRHYGATRAALAGATLRELQERLGHSTVAAAMKYQHTAGRDAELARRMSELT